jgi:protein TonB
MNYPHAGSLAMRMDAPGMNAYSVLLDAVSKRARPRLVVACGLSLLLHVTLLVGIPVNPTGGLPKVVSVITARLEPAAPAALGSPPATTEGESVAERVAPVAADPVAPEIAGTRKPAIGPSTETRPESQPAVGPASTPSAGLEVPFIRDPTYYPTKQLDVFPQPLTPIRLDYPDSAANARVDGRLTILLLIDEFGIVNDVSVTDAKPEGYFEEATLAVFRAARFSPAQKQGHPVKSRVMLQVKYLYGDGAGAMR